MFKKSRLFFLLIDADQAENTQRYYATDSLLLPGCTVAVAVQAVCKY